MGMYLKGGAVYMMLFFVSLFTYEGLHEQKVP